MLILNNTSNPSRQSGMNISNFILSESVIELFYYWTTLNSEILPALHFQLEVYYKVDRQLTDVTAQQIGTTA